jgi:ABC-type branched-subunit amino acid transport system permease subunit
MMRRLAGGSQSRLIGLVMLGALFLLPFFTDDPYWLFVLATALLFGILAMSLDLLWGYAGVLNLAPALSFGLGAYAWAIIGADVDGVLGTYLGLGAAVLLPAAAGALVAFVSFFAGARGIYFALITLSLTLVVKQVVQSATQFTGGSNGIIGIPWPTLGVPGVFETTINSTSSFFQLTVVVTAIVFWIVSVLANGRFGTVLEAIRENDQRVETLGYSTLRYRVMVSAISAGIGGLAGMLYAPLTGIVDPSLFGVELSVQAFVWVAVGGQGTLLGPLIAAVLISIGQQTLTGSSASLYLLGIATVFVAIVLLLPGGLASLVPKLKRLIAGASDADGSGPSAETRMRDQAP